MDSINVSGSQGNSNTTVSTGSPPRGLLRETACRDFKSHEITIDSGENVVQKIMSFAAKGPRGICVLTASGQVSKVVIRKPDSSSDHETLTREGHFELLSLSGSYTSTDATGRPTGGLSVSFADSNGNAIGGALIVFGSFIPYDNRHKKTRYRKSLRARADNAVPVEAEPPQHNTRTAIASTSANPNNGGKFGGRKNGGGRNI
ncbi:hypothetical protein F8388_009426 [Cannabis sativa]|uniref:AT-hook motif nuclear-localized protein n=1 Tax=Cannabis sativa TaxID=3483 RepID=A0A7J6EI92_CANSA|nr:hypothetical protein F8388_009426 [Cannabis sativa]KAF4387152.1 hypothetical protein G4B88_024724 [Cannabis sativa]